jgi:hypothetical protein
MQSLKIAAIPSMSVDRLKYMGRNMMLSAIDLQRRRQNARAPSSFS